MLPAAIGIIFSKDLKEVLLVKRHDAPVWVLPGGGIDPGESAEEAVIREVLEETGLKTKIVRKVARYLPANSISAETSSFECSIEGGTLTPSSESPDLRFFPLSHLPRNIFFAHRIWIKETLHKKEDVITRPLYEICISRILFFGLSHPLIGIRYMLALACRWLNSRGSNRHQNNAE
jgi:8-oxo-dGTP diphosphatase